MTPNDVQVEAAARVLSEFDWSVDCGMTKQEWADCNWQLWVDHARAALAASPEQEVVKPFLYGARFVATGEPWLDEDCVSVDAGYIADRIEDDNGVLELVALYAVAPPSQALRVPEDVRSFVYAILGADTWLEAGAIWDGNPEQRKAAHAAFAGSTEAMESQALRDRVAVLEREQDNLLSWFDGLTPNEMHDAIVMDKAKITVLEAALKPFATVGRIIDGPFGPALFSKNEMAFKSGCAWSENGVNKTLTWGDFRRAAAALNTEEPKQ